MRTEGQDATGGVETGPAVRVASSEGRSGQYSLAKIVLCLLSARSRAGAGLAAETAADTMEPCQST